MTIISKNVPVTLNGEVIGRAEVCSDGTANLTILHQGIIDMLTADSLHELSIGTVSAKPVYEKAEEVVFVKTKTTCSCSVCNEQFNLLDVKLRLVDHAKLHGATTIMLDERFVW